ncbi:hypothetical protein HFP89_10765 [Wenzhouxiangella sp. XN79A]|uniref:hypothetical protein n=1 Tax=Wenzhouxiangella sp. XN79A TaxID=2724193 RepID=UPI00144A958C|nr:hypothetical protein [Wenzhouxiangella sp. XN79A]NKI35646.1 hypothetical protein [Wenzhouxiangella sp. XN79A]
MSHPTRTILAAATLALAALPATQARAEWPLGFGSANDDVVIASATASTGDVLLTGHFSGTIETEVGTLQSNGQRDIFVARVSATGRLLWVASGGSQFDDTVYDLVLDDGDNVFIAGDFQDSGFFGGNEIVSAGQVDGFIARIDPVGDWRWARRMGGPGPDRAASLDTLPGDGSQIPPIPDSVVAVGFYECSASFQDVEPDPDQRVPSLNNDNCPGRDLFIARYSDTGDALWAVDRAGTATGIESATRIRIDDAGRAWITGQFAQGGTTVLNSENFDGLSPWTSSNPQFGSVRNTLFSFGFATDPPVAITSDFFNPGLDPALALRGGDVDVESPVRDTSDSQQVRVSLEGLRGFNDRIGGLSLFGIYSEYPDANDDVYLEWWGSDDQWHRLYTFPGGGDAREEFDLTGDSSLAITDPRAFHPGFKLRFAGRGFDGIGTRTVGGITWNVAYDWWFFDNVVFEKTGVSVPMIFSVSNLRSLDPRVSDDQTELPEALTLNDMTLSADGSSLYVAGSTSAPLTYSPCAGQPAGAYVARLGLSTSGVTCQAATGAAGGIANGITLDNQGRVYVTGEFSGTLDIAGESLSAAGMNDVFIASWEPSATGNALNPRWATGGGFFDETDGIPAFTGGFGMDGGTAISTDGVGNIYVAGAFSDVATFGENVTVAALGGTDAFLASLTLDGLFFEQKSWTAGVPLIPPPEAKVDNVVFAPDFRVNGQPFDAIGQKIFSWQKADGEDARLIPLQPFPEIEVRWRQQGLDLQDPARISSLGGIGWPNQPCGDLESIDCYQVHIIDAPVNAEPASGQWRVLELVDPESGSSSPTLDSGVFNASRSGTAVLVYVNGPEPDPVQYSTSIEIVRTLPATSTPLFTDGVPVEIGQKITDPYHEELGRTGFVVNELAYYDGVGPDAAYSRSSRTGAIIPVNRINPGRSQDQGRELVVAWYHGKSRGVFWPEKGVRYDPFWPLDPDRIIIASQQGGEVLGQQPLDPLIFPSARIYSQNDRSLPGYNPNDEHALMAPSSTGTPFEAVFALRSDFGSAIADDQSAASDPYVLVKYFDAGDSEWKFRVYSVEAIGGGFTSFRFNGTAGTTVAPPYPVSLLPGCAETFVVGQAANDPQPPAPFFQDYKNQLWAKSAGSGDVRYFYPAQPGWQLDLDNNDVNDLEPGACVPWLARLPNDQGGSGSPRDPITVGYDITWPSDTPLLVSGETLLTPKRGLPDIFNQAAVEVVFDEIQDTRPDPLPDETLAQLIDPLNPRSVALDALPDTVASSLQTDGTRLILGSSDGVTKLPASVRQRLAYDPLNRRLMLKGIFDESGVGEPFLLLNVLSKRDRAALKEINDGDDSNENDFDGACATPGDACSWDQAIEALFRQSRNPQGVNRICESSSIGENRIRTCDASRPVTVDDVLVGVQDRNDDGLLEPFQAVGVRPALTAGLSQGSGFMTVAFNNDASLNPLPVSLQVIRVGCLVSENPAFTKPYQGQIQIIEPDNIFDEQLVLRHSGDFGGNPDALEFQWFFHPDVDGNPPLPLPDPATGQLNGWIQFPTPDPQGAVEISIEGANIQTLSDNWYVARYRGLPTCTNDSDWSIYAGDPTATPVDPSPQLAEGWVKRVLGRLNPFEARVSDFAQAATNNYASMLVQLGERYEGPVPLTNDPDVLNSLGLIETYTTVLNRALALSVKGTPPIDFGPANNAILLVASRIVDFYTLLGNEAFADAQDPTIGITTSNGDFSLAPTIFNFQNQMATVLEEELTLLRGRDESLGGVAGAPVYNRLFWNFTTGDGEVAYSQSYNISDQNFDGFLDEDDARILFPQGHGDAWGHYLTATDVYYNLLNEEFYSWNPRIESLIVAGAPINVDFLDERQFAETAAAKARTGAEIVDLTYRSEYVADPNGQFQGYEDTDPDRAWGLSEWGSRSGMAAYFDWVTVNSILPSEDPDPTHVGIERVERGTVAEIDEISAMYATIQEQVDEADAGLNPLGLADGVLVFDMDPSQLDRFNKTNTEQVLERAESALANAIEVWDFANELSNQMRRNQNEVEDLNRDSRAQETDFANQLIEIFGTPYSDDIGPTGNYPAGYDGADLYNYMLIDVPALAGTAFDFDGGLNLADGESAFRVNSFDGQYTPVGNGIDFFNWTPIAEGEEYEGSNGVLCSISPLAEGCALGDLATENEDGDNLLNVTYTTIESPDLGFWFTKPTDWTGTRRAPGQLQEILQNMLQARIALRQSLVSYDRLRQEIDAKIDELEATFDTTQDNLNLTIQQRNELQDLTIATQVMKNSAIVAKRIGEFTDFTFRDTVECIPRVFIAGLAAGGDMTSGIRCGIKQAGNGVKLALDTVADGLEIASNATDAAKEDVSQVTGIETAINDAELNLFNVKGEIDEMIREEPILRAEVFARAEAIKQHLNDYKATLARGLRVLERLKSFRRNGAAEVQEYRYQDLAFRIFRNDALQKYRAAFDLAARYVYLAASAYDYETNLLGTDGESGQSFLTDIVRERSLGSVIGGQPQPGSPGLASQLAQLRLNFEVLKGQMGFNNPQVETNRFSLREELFRIPPGPEGDAEWRDKLEELRVDNIWDYSDFRRYARPFAPESAGPQPGLIIEFPTNVTFGLNFFGWELGPGDSSYDSSQFATRIRSLGSWFGNYAELPLADDPRIYLIPVGADVLRAPDAFDFRTREWQIVEQVMPVPFPISSQDLERFDWSPLTDTLSGSAAEIRRYGRFRAFHFDEQNFDDAEVTSDSRLVGRSVWNTKWVMIIPGGTFLNDANEGLETFINGTEIPGGERDGQGVSDILIFFKTYAYSGQ